jgi:hypothetical protein
MLRRCRDGASVSLGAGRGLCWAACAGRCGPPDGRHGGDLPVIRHGELGRQAGPVERPELPDVQAQCLGLHGQVGDGLAEVIQRELGVLPVGVFHVAMGQVGDEQARRRRPGTGTAGQIPDQAGVGGIRSSP